MVMTPSARSTYDAAVDHFDERPLRFWDRYGTATIERLGLAPGAAVIDVCAGTGGSAIPAARAVGACGSVLAVDISARLLDLAWHKAEREGLRNLAVHVADMTRLELSPASFDAAVIVFGLFFADDMAAQVRTLWRLVRPGGVLAITTWGEQMFEPLYTPFLDEARRRAPDLAPFTPWDRLTTPAAITRVLREAGVAPFEIEPEAGSEPLARPEDWWTIVLGTGLRWYVDPLAPAAAASLRDACVEHARSVPSIATNVLYTVARKPRRS